MNIKFISDDDLSLNKPMKLHAMTIIIRSVFEEDGKLYPQLFLKDTLRIESMRKSIFQKELMLVKQVWQKNVCFAIIGTLKMLDSNLNQMSVTNAMMFG